MKKRLLALTLSGLMLISSISPANIQAYASEPSDAFSTVSGNNPQSVEDETESETEESTESTGNETNWLLDDTELFWNLRNSGFATGDVSGNDLLLTSLAVDIPKDVTDDRESISEFKVTLGGKTKNGGDALTPKADGSYELKPGVLPSDVDYFEMTINLKITDEFGKRNLNPGDYIQITMPTGLDLSGVPSPSAMKITGTETAFANATASGSTVKITFTDIIDDVTGDQYTYDSMFGGMSFKFNFQGLADGQSADYEIDWGNSGKFTIHVPEPSANLSGIQKSGVFDKTTGRVKWTVKVGDDTDKTISLKDYVLKDTFDKSKQKLIMSSVKMGATTITVTDTSTTTTDGFSYKFNDVKAPQTITYETLPTDVDFLMGNGGKLTNNVTLQSPQQVEINEPGFSKTAEVTGPKSFMKKTGTQISSDVYEWTINYNEDGIKVWKATVYDDLAEGLTYVTGSAKLNGAALPDGVSVNTSGQRVNIVFANETVASKTYKITFQTKVDPETFAGKEGSGDNIENIAHVNAEFPNATGTDGIPVNYGAPKVNCPYSAAFIEKKALTDEDAKKRHADGYIPWEIHPSTKSVDGAFYYKAVIKDTPGSNQSWVPEKLNVTASKSGSTTILVENGKVKEDACALSDSGKTITIDHTKLNNLGYELGNVTIRVETKANTYFTKDGVEEYPNTVDLELQNSSGQKVAGATASDKITLTGKLLKKTVVVEPLADPTAPPSDTNRNYFHYTMIVNENQMSLHNATLVDDFASADCNLNVGGSALTQSYYAIDATKSSVTELGSSTKITDGVTYTDSKFTFAMGNTNKAYQIDLYVYLTDDGREALKTNTLKNKTIATKNKAILTTDETGDFAGEVTSKGETDQFNNTFLIKDGVQKGKSFEWTIYVNLGNANLRENPTITDVIPKGLYLDADSIQIRHVRYKATGGNIPAGPTGENLIGQPGFTKKVTRNLDETAIMELTLPNNAEQTYAITYTTDGTKKEASFTNNASLKSSHVEVSKSKSVTVNSTLWSGGSAIVMFNVLKLDALSDDSNKIPLAGAEYVLLKGDKARFTDADGNLDDTKKGDYIVDYKKTDAEGKCYLYGRYTAGAQYYIAEVNAPEGFVRDTKVYGPYTMAAPGEYTGKVGTGTKSYFTNKRVEEEEKLAELKVKKQFGGAAANATLQLDDTAVKTAEFELFIYPNGKKNGKVDKTYKQKVGETIKVSGAEEAEITVSDLYWGEYELVEKTMPKGYIGKASIEFSVDQAGKLTFGTGVNATKQGSGENTTVILSNAQTGLTLKKTDSDGHAIDADLMAEAEFELAPAADQAAGVTAEFADGTTGAKTLNNQALSNGLLISGLLKTGTKYTLTEKKAPKYYLAMEPVTFMINADGKIAKVGARTDVTADDTTHTLIVKNTIKPIVLDMIKVGPSTGGSERPLLSGAKVTVSGDFADGTTTKTFTTDATGTYTFTNQLKRGKTYHVTEVIPAPGYGKTTDFDIVVDEDGYVALKLDGLTDKVKNEITDETVAERVDDDDAYHSKVTTESPQTLVHFDTTVNRFESSIPAAAQKEVPVQGIQYTVYEDENGNTPVMVNGSPLVVSSDADGKVTIPGLSVNTDEKPYYYIKETGYAGTDQSQLSTKLTDTVYRAKVTGKNFDGIQVKDGSAWKNVENNQIPHDTYTGTVTVTKQGEGNTPLPGAVYGVYRKLSSYPTDAQPALTNLIASKQLTSYTSNGETWILLDQKTTDDSGEVHFDTPVAGEEYMIREIQSPAGYTPSNPVVVTMKLTTTPSVGGTASAVATLPNGTTATNLTQTAPKVVLNVETLSNTNPKTYLGPVHLVLTDDAGRTVDEWGTTVSETDELDSNGDPVLDENGNPKKVKIVNEKNHLVQDTNKRLVVGKTYTVTATTVPSGFAKTSMKFTLKPATSQVEQIVIGKYVAPSNSNGGSSHSDNHGGQNAATPDKSKVTDSEQTDSQIVVINQAGTDDGSHIKDKTGLNGKKHKNGTSVATAGSRKENGVVKSVRRALEAAFGAISGSYRKLVTKTGDEAPIIGMIALLLIAVAGITTVLIHKRKKK